MDIARLRSKPFKNTFLLSFNERIKKGIRKNSPGPGKLKGGRAEINNRNDKSTATRITIHVTQNQECHHKAGHAVLQK